MLRVKKSVKEDWTLLPFLVATSAGFIVAILDFVFLQNLRFQAFALVGLFLLLTGGYLRMKARLELKKKAGFSSFAETARLQTMESHQLVKDGLYKHIRHPIYLGETVRNFGLVSFLEYLRDITCCGGNDFYCLPYKDRGKDAYSCVWRGVQGIPKKYEENNTLYLLNF